MLIRRWEATDSIAALTALLHRSYAQLAAMGLKYTAVDQDEGVTKKRTAAGDCYVAIMDAAVVGTFTLYPPGRLDQCAWYRMAGTAVLAQLAVEPAYQRRGIGSALLDFAVERAMEMGARELALDTAESAGHLIVLYAARGYRVVDSIQWPGKTYRSVVMSRVIAPLPQ